MKIYFFKTIQSKFFLAFLAGLGAASTAMGMSNLTAADYNHYKALQLGWILKIPPQIDTTRNALKGVPTHVRKDESTHCILHYPRTGYAKDLQGNRQKISLYNRPLA